MSDVVSDVLDVARQYDCWSVSVWGDDALVAALTSSRLSVRAYDPTWPYFADLVVVPDGALIEKARKLARKAVLCVTRDSHTVVVP